MTLGRLGWLLLFVWPIATSQPYILHVAVMVMLMASTALSLNIMTRMGRLSMMHGALMGIGAYSASLLTIHEGFSFLLATCLAGLVTATVAAVIGPIFLRIKGVYFVLLTFALSEVILLIFTEWTSVFGGASGLMGMPAASIFGVPLTEPKSFYYLTLVLLFASYFFIRGLYRSSFGTVLDGLNEEERIVESLGASAHWYRLIAFCVSAALSGVVGSIYAHYLAFLVPGAFGFKLDVDLILINVLGGFSSPAGPIVGAILLVPLPELLRGSVEYQVLIYGGLLICLPILLPDGLIPWLEKRRVR